MALTPMMQQYESIKQSYQDTLLFFRLGDFYEMFFEDAITASKELEITLTGRDAGIEERVPMCGVPYHAADGYIKRLIEKGFKVAICEQVEDPALAKGIVKREVIKVITPGTHLDDASQDPTYLAILAPQGGQEGLANQLFALAFVSVMTGDMYLEEHVDLSDVLENMNKYRPVEWLVHPDLNPLLMQRMEAQLIRKASITNLEQWQTSCDPYQLVVEQFGEDVSKTSGIPEDSFAWTVCGYMLSYLKQTQKKDIHHLKPPVRLNQTGQLFVDTFTRRNLELLETLRDRKKEGSLFWVLDRSITAMGSRMIKQWLLNPLYSVPSIEKRQDAIQELVDQFMLREDLKQILRNVYDLERLVAKLSYGSANAKDLIALCQTLKQFPLLEQVLDSLTADEFKSIKQALIGFAELADRIANAIVPDPPLGLKDGGIIQDGYDPALDRYRTITREGKSWIAALEQQERNRTSIKSLKIGFNKVFGYYIEVTKSNVQLVPEDYERKQTLANAERYVTKELKQREAEILHAEDRLTDLEYELFIQVRAAVTEKLTYLQLAASALAKLDGLYALATVAVEEQYVRPIVDHSDLIEIREGRHPVVERMLTDTKFVANDTYLDGKDKQIMLITGPNMAGKSTYMRQVALITMLAHMGSFVPADYARIGLVDRVFTRIGAADDLAGGQSTFMVEMVELANILKHATKKSLVILDEIGRGTSTYDGISIARAVVEYLHDSKTGGAKTLFATHYHELTVLGEELKGVVNYSTQVQDTGDSIVFLRKIHAEPADRSYGIHVAQLADLPQPVLDRAKTILYALESQVETIESQVERISQNQMQDPLQSGTYFSQVESAAAKEIVSEDALVDPGNPVEVTEATAQLSFFAEQNIASQDTYAKPTKQTGTQDNEAKIAARIRNLDLIHMTPLAAINELFELQQQLRKGQSDR